MARARNIKPGFFRNADLVELPVETRLLFIGLWTLADREGRLEDRPRQIKMELFPADSFDVGSMLDQLQAAKFITRYEFEGTRFIEVENFIKHQDPHYKEKASEIPPPPGRENFMRAVAVTKTQRARILERDGYACKLCGAVDALCIDHIIPVSRGGSSEDDNLQVLCSACNTKKGNKIDGEGTNSRQRRINIDPNLNQRKRPSPSDSLIPDSLIPEENTHTPLASDWVLPKTLGEWAIAEFPAWTVETVRSIASNFADHFRGSGGSSADWSATWRKWCRDPLTHKAIKPARDSPSAGPKLATADSDAAAKTAAALAKTTAHCSSPEAKAAADAARLAVMSRHTRPKTEEQPA